MSSLELSSYILFLLPRTIRALGEGVANLQIQLVMQQSCDLLSISKVQATGALEQQSALVSTESLSLNHPILPGTRWNLELILWVYKNNLIVSLESLIDIHLSVQ